MRRRTQQLTLSAMFMALAILFPMLFHAVGLGSTFLPMFWPLATAAFLLRPPLALSVAILAPILSSLMTGMPPISPPILHVMIIELILLSGTISLLYQRTGLGTIWILLIGLFMSRLALFFIVMVLAPILGLPGKIFSAGLIAQGLPGVIAMIVVVPVVVSRMKGEPLFASR
ncbi:ECF transporter S component [candidate division KSB1 bacterium]|nr:ECF transporter S component [candidate division KSB1 bacterium]RQW04697.1 MAG: ECF transporter S component [candidate division KSB1 bacterium]